jgi:hypothetical protein
MALPDSRATPYRIFGYQRGVIVSRSNQMGLSRAGGRAGIRWFVKLVKPTMALWAAPIGSIPQHLSRDDPLQPSSDTWVNVEEFTSGLSGTFPIYQGIRSSDARANGPKGKGLSPNY